MGCYCTHDTATLTRDRTDTNIQLEIDREENVVSHGTTSRAFHRRYVLGEKIGEGSFARVYACRKIGDDLAIDYAVKIADLRGYTDDRRQSLAQQEASILRRIGIQKHCCRLIDSVSLRGFHYIVLERCNITLLQALEDMPELTECSLARLVRQMFLGVASIHALGVVHRDIKPDNFILTGPGGTVKLCDFGLAEVLHSNTGGVTGVNGTAPFMSPEMIAGSVYGRPTDVWSLGVMLYTLVIGQFPYVPEGPAAKFMMAAIASGVPEPSFECVAAGVQLSLQVLALLKALLCRDPAARLSVTEALENSWFGPDGAYTPEQQQHSLKETLQSAKRAGAFKMHGSVDEVFFQSLDSMDEALQEMQDAYLPRAGKGKASIAVSAESSPSSLSSTASPCRVIASL